MWCEIPDQGQITCARFQNEILRCCDSTVGRNFHFPIYFWIAIITVRRYCAACDISDSANSRKMANFHPSWSQKPWIDFNETWNIWLRPGPQPKFQYTVEVSSTWVVWANDSLPHILFFCFLRHLYTKTRLLANVCLLGVLAYKWVTPPR